MRLDFYHWGTQCPLIARMLDLFDKGAARFEIRTHDVTNDFTLASQQRMFFPYLTVLENSRRFFKPVDESFFERIRGGRAITESSWLIEQSTNRYDGEILPLQHEGIQMACQCAGDVSPEQCQQKAAFLTAQGDTHIYGYLNTDEGRVLGGVEYMPSLSVPYDIPRGEDTAFLTCTYHSSGEHDYKAGPLEALEGRLQGRYAHLLAITDDEGVFPNGNLRWFLTMGYQDMGIVSTEPGYCRLHLVGKKLPAVPS